MSKKRAFVRYTKSGEIVPGSLIITTNGGYPDKSSLWQEVSAYKCCDDSGNCPPVTSFCAENWAFENFDGTTFRNGDPIPQVTNDAAWASLTTPAWCYFLNDTDNGRIYGKLYNGYAINDSRGLAPEGWRIPTKNDWTNLYKCLGGEIISDYEFGGYTTVGNKMKTTGNTDDNTGLWDYGNPGATNSSGFSVLPGSFRSGLPLGVFPVPPTNNGAVFWTSSQYDSNNNFASIFNSQLDISYFLFNHNTYGCSVRLIKDI